MIVASFRCQRNRFKQTTRLLSSHKRTIPFLPRRRPGKTYRQRKPLKTPDPGDLRANAGNVFHSDFDPFAVDLSHIEDDDSTDLGPIVEDTVKEFKENARREREGIYFDDVEEEMRLADYFSAEPGSTEELVGDRRGLSMDFSSDEEREEYVNWVERSIEEAAEEDMLGEAKRGIAVDIADEEEDDGHFDLMGDTSDGGEMDRETFFDPNQKAHGEWSEFLVDTDRTTKMWRGGRLESYRALVVGGNLNGCAGFGIGKSSDAITAVDVAGRACKRNIFFVERYQGRGLTRDLVGKQNSCKVVLRASNRGLAGNYLIREILKRFGITNCSAKAHGNRNPYNVVRATFKALMTHESVEDIALKRGKRLASIDRTMRMQL